MPVDVPPMPGLQKSGGMLNCARRGVRHRRIDLSGSIRLSESRAQPPSALWPVPVDDRLAEVGRHAQLCLTRRRHPCFVGIRETGVRKRTDLHRRERGRSAVSPADSPSGAMTERAPDTARIELGDELSRMAGKVLLYGGRVLEAPVEDATSSRECAGSNASCGLPPRFRFGPHRARRSNAVWRRSAGWPHPSGPPELEWTAPILGVRRGPRETSASSRGLLVEWNLSTIYLEVGIRSGAKLTARHLRAANPREPSG